MILPGNKKSKLSADKSPTCSRLPSKHHSFLSLFYDFLINIVKSCLTLTHIAPLLHWCWYKMLQTVAQHNNLHRHQGNLYSIFIHDVILTTNSIIIEPGDALLNNVAASEPLETRQRVSRQGGALQSTQIALPHLFYTTLVNCQKFDGKPKPLVRGITYWTSFANDTMSRYTCAHVTLH